MLTLLVGGRHDECTPGYLEDMHRRHTDPVGTGPGSRHWRLTSGKDTRSARWRSGRRKKNFPSR